MAIKQPFGNDLNSTFFGSVATLTKGTAATTKHIRAVSSMINFFRIATATKGKKVRFDADADLPAGAIIMISAQSASSEILLSTGFAGPRPFINGATAAVGTGDWAGALIYDGTNFRWMGRPTTKGRKLIF